MVASPSSLFPFSRSRVLASSKRGFKRPRFKPSAESFFACAWIFRVQPASFKMASAFGKAGKSRLESDIPFFFFSFQCLLDAHNFFFPLSRLLLIPIGRICIAFREQVIDWPLLRDGFFSFPFSLIVYSPLHQTLTSCCPVCFAGIFPAPPQLVREFLPDCPFHDRAQFLLTF